MSAATAACAVEGSAAAEPPTACAAAVDAAETARAGAGAALRASGAVDAASVRAVTPWEAGGAGSAARGATAPGDAWGIS